MNRKTVVITGGTGLIGTALSRYLLTNNYGVVVLTRHPEKARNNHAASGLQYAHWDVTRQTIDSSAISGASAIVHLAGAGVVDKPWTDAYKKEIIDSRVNSSALLVKALRETASHVETVVSASAIGWYGPDRPHHPAFVETDAADAGFLGETCRLWEESIAPVKAPGKRLVICRFGIVLSKDGGALKEFIKPLKARVAVVMGDGAQMVSWIHIHDLCRLITYAIENPGLSGVYNAVAPAPVTSRALTLTLARAMYGNAFITAPVPAFVLKMMMGERSIEILKSATVSSVRTEATGFQFRFPGIEQALKNIVGESRW